MKATLQRLTGETHVLRLHPDFEGDPNQYTGSASVGVVTGREGYRIATLFGLVMTQPFDTVVYRAIIDALRDAEVDEVVWQRRNSKNEAGQTKFRTLKRIITR